MEAKHFEMITQLKESCSCDKDFACTNAEGNGSASIRDIGLDEYVECLSDDRRSCRHALSFGHAHLCRCPMRLYMVRNELGVHAN